MFKRIAMMAERIATRADRGVVISEPIAVIYSAEQLEELLPEIGKFERIAIDTEADSLHCYREKLCLIQLSLPSGDHLVDPLAEVDLSPLAKALENKTIVVQGADFD